jgi:glycosyltransferase involved in cell wall biosynthesis
VRVLQINNVSFEAGGAEKSVRMSTDGLRARGHEVAVLATDRLTERFPDQPRYADHLIPAIRGRAIRRFVHYRYYPPAVRAVTELMASFRPDLVHLHTIGEFSPAALGPTAGVPRVLTVHGPEDWTKELLRWNLRSAASGRLSGPDLLRLIYLRTVQRPPYLRQIRRLDAVIAPSRYIATTVAPDVADVPVHVVPNAAELPGVTPVPASEVVLFVGRLENVKGVQTLLSAFAQVVAERPAARLRIVGEGTFRPILEQQATALQLGSRVEFVGHRDRAAVEAELRDCRVFVVPSIWPENFPLAVLEAIGTGRPVVASRIGGLPEIVEHGRTGLLVPPAEPEALAGALRRLLGDLDGARAMGAAAAERAGRFALEPFLDATEAVYAEALGTADRPSGHPAGRHR